METTPTLLADFAALFGDQPNGCDKNRLAHCQESPTIVTLCRAAMERGTEELLDYFDAWDQSADDNKPYTIEQFLAASP